MFYLPAYIWDRSIDDYSISGGGSPIATFPPLGCKCRPKFHKSPSPESAMWTIGHTDRLPQRRAALKVLRPRVFEVSSYFEATVAITANAIEVSLSL
ncbi:MULTISPECIES: hypothetical protein [unclassified Microcoleus]|uniref:hypothetical protein n=1 Tax=unclassified Microcoleus TaxID=2642155 RepID=UPI002FCED82E